MIGKLTAGVLLSATLGAGGAGTAFAATSGQTSTPARVSCNYAQQRVNLLSAEQVVLKDRVGLLQVALDKAKAKNNTAREQKIQSRIDKADAAETKVGSRLNTLEQACHVTPQAGQAS